MADENAKPQAPRGERPRSEIRERKEAPQTAEGKKVRKIAFRPGTDFDSPPSNSEPAEKKARE